MPRSRKKSQPPSPRKKRPSDAVAALVALRDPEHARLARHYFRDAGDFLGVRVPQVRRIALQYASVPFEELLASKWHEVRLLAVVIMIRQYERGDEAARERIFRAYLDNTDRIDNWDLIDISAPRIVGAHLVTRSRALLTKLAKSKSLWERRIAMLAAGKLGVAETLRVARILLRDDHDLIHKAVGWMLREAGKKDRAALVEFLEEHAATMPRVMLRYAIEKFPAADRARFMNAFRNTR